MNRLIPILSLGALLACSDVALAQPVARPLAPLSTVEVPTPSNLGEFVKNRHVAIALGKALFWDMQAGSDGKVACATCHWHAGADARFRNTLGQPKDKDVPIDNVLKKLTNSDFPLTKISGDPTSPDAEVVSNNELIVGSQGAFLEDFVRVVEGRAKEIGSHRADPVFNYKGVNVRTVTGRNSPSVINSVFNHRQNWDGRADSVFNGVNQYGRFDDSARVLKTRFYYRSYWDYFVDRVTRSRHRAIHRTSKVKISMENASLASQAMAPPLETEMGSVGRTFPDLGRKMLTLRPLGRQHVFYTDSVLAPFDNHYGRGLRVSYPFLIRHAFHDKWWAGKHLDADGFTQMESNFGLFWGISMLMYQATLVSDQTPLDKFLAGDQGALSPAAQQGKSIFEQGCNICHSGPETSSATVSELYSSGTFKSATIMLRGREFNIPTFYDRGYYNIGAQPTENDLGGEGSDAFGVFSFTLRARQGQDIGQTVFDAPINALPVAIRGTFKAPMLRNVELTGPYNHNGGKRTLQEVIEFYTRGADFREENFQTLDQGVSGIPPLQAQAAVGVPALVEFLKSMTDERVRNQAAPFDHPELFLPNGIRGIRYGRVYERFMHFPAVGRYGVTKFGTGTISGKPLISFADRLTRGH